jgi:uncharacterized membrane protein
MRRRVQSLGVVSALRRWRKDNRGVTALVVALSFTALGMATAVSIDLGSLFLNARRLQGIADLSAMAAAQGLTTGTTTAADITAANTAATNTVAVNPWPYAVTTTVTPGVYSPDPTLSVANRFTATNTSPNAAKVTLTAPVKLVFVGLLIGNPTLQLTRTATAASTQLTAFSIGSGLATLNGGVANALLSALTGSSVSLSVMNYNALLGANVDLFSYLSALSTRMNLTAGSYNSLLSGQVSMPTALAALGDTLNAEGQSGAASAVNQLVSASASAPPVQLSALFNLGPYTNQDNSNFSTGGASVSLNAMSTISALLQAANGARQLQLNLGATIPGVTAVTAYLAIGQRPSNSPWIAITNANNVIVSTAQMRLYLTATVSTNGLLPGLGLLTTTLPAYVELASAQAKLASLQCASTPSQQNVTLSVLPSLGQIAIAQIQNTSTLQNFTQPVTLQSAPLLNVALLGIPVASASVYADVNLGGGANGWQSVSFSGTDIANGAMKSASVQNLTQATLGSLLGNTSVSATVLGSLSLTVSNSALQQSLINLLSPVASGLDGVVNQITSLAGVQLGVADVWVNGLRCQGAALVA